MWRDAAMSESQYQRWCKNSSMGGFQYFRVMPAPGWKCTRIKMSKGSSNTPHTFHMCSCISPQKHLCWDTWGTNMPRGAASLSPNTHPWDSAPINALQGSASSFLQGTSHPTSVCSMLLWSLQGARRILLFNFWMGGKRRKKKRIPLMSPAKC